MTTRWHKFSHALCQLRMLNNDDDDDHDDDDGDDDDDNDLTFSAMDCNV